MIRKYYEVSCDYCGCAEHFPIGGSSAIEQARSYGWIITKDGQHFDFRKCYKAARKKKLMNRNLQNTTQKG